jgi:twitching motility protein PilT
MSAPNLGAMRIEELLRAARARGASDVHLAIGEAAVLRIDGRLVRRDDVVVTPAELDAFLRTRMESRPRESLDAHGCCDAAVGGPDIGPLRLHVFRALGGMRCAVRLFPEAVPRLETLDLPPVIARLVLERSGLVLIVGPTGSGKTTLLASMIDLLNHGHARHVVTLEDPIEYYHRADASVVAQCEIGRDVPDVASAIHAVLRADPDVIVVGELRDAASIRGALAAAETGHLVLASLHTADAPGALDRMVGSFPIDGREQVRAQLAATLVGVVAVRLVPRACGQGRRAAAEILVATDAVRHLVREGKTHQLRSAIQTGRGAGMQTLEMHLSALSARGEISGVTAREFAQRPAEISTSESGPP